MCDDAPVGEPEVVIHRVLTAAMTYPRCASRNFSVFRPSAFNLLATDTPNARHIVKREFVMTLLLVRAEMLLRNRVSKSAWSLGDFELYVFGKPLKSLEEESGPEADDVVRSDGRRKLAVELETRCQYIIHITVSVQDESRAGMTRTTATHRSPF